MFGYIKPYKGELKVSENDFYQSVYCGLCKRLKNNYGLVSTFTLNYDFTFLALLKMSLSQKEQKVEKGKCAVYPFRKRLICFDDEALDFSAACATVIIYYKTQDSLIDNGFKGKLKGRLYSPFSNSHIKKLEEPYLTLFETVGGFMKEQKEIEDSKSDNIDLASDPSAKSLQEIFAMLSQDPVEKRVLSRFGYLLGRWVYFIDALDDLEDDLEKGNYNPFLIKYNIETISDIHFEEIYSQVEPILNLTIGEIASTFHLLNLFQYRSMLENIVYLGLKNTQQAIKNKRSKVNE